MLALRPVVDEAAEAALASARAGIEFRNDIAADLVVDADPEHLFRMALNLLRNAVEALSGRPGGRIVASAERNGKLVSITIADNGPGIPASFRARLFQPFAAPLKPSGSGLGLAITRDLARLHGGEASLVESGQGGATFRIDIPDREET
jgi:signal transduction histidine kinase